MVATICHNDARQFVKGYLPLVQDIRQGDDVLPIVRLCR